MGEYTCKACSKFKGNYFTTVLDTVIALIVNYIVFGLESPHIQHQNCPQPSQREVNLTSRTLTIIHRAANLIHYNYIYKKCARCLYDKSSQSSYLTGRQKSWWRTQHSTRHWVGHTQKSCITITNYFRVFLKNLA